MENTIQKSFFSKNNIDSLKAWMTENFATKKGYNIDANDLQKTVVEYMNKVYSSKDTFIPSKMPPKQKLINLNKKVVQIANGDLPSKIETFVTQQKDKVSNIQRGYDVPDTKERILMTRPDDQNLLKKTKSNVENKYQQMTNEREIKKPTQTPIFEDESNVNYENTSDLYDKIMDMRNNEDKVVAFQEEGVKEEQCFIPYEPDEPGTSLFGDKLPTNDHCNPFENSSREKTVIEKKGNIDNVVPKNIKETYSIVNDRNEDEIFIKDKFCDNDPKELYMDVLSKSKIDTMTPIPKTSEVDFVTKPDLTNKNIVNHEVIINAADRNWYGYWEDNGDGTNVLRRSGNYNRYSFMVKFSPGDISDDMDSKNSLNILRTFNNIQMVSLQTMNMGFYDNTFAFKNNDEYINADFRAQPFILLSIDELNNYTQTTSKKRFPYFSKLNTQTAITVRDKNRRGYGTLIPALQSKRDFYNNPLQQLDKMSINILNPDGNLYGYENSYNIDNVLVKNITFENSDNGTKWIADANGKTNYIVLNVEPYINRSQYKIGDQLIVKGLRCCQPITDNSRIVFDTSKLFYKKLEDYINREEGHTIVKVGAEGDIPDFTNKLYIKTDYSIDFISGTYSNSLYDQYINDGFGVANDDSIDTMGELINYSIQPTITLDIKTIDFFIAK